METPEDDKLGIGCSEAILVSPTSEGASPEHNIPSEAHDEDVSGNQPLQQDETDSLRPNEWDFRTKLIIPSMK
jgi:hypothetical protein